LRDKGIAPALIREVVRDAFDQVDEWKKAKTLLEKRFKNQTWDDSKMLRRAAGFLKRRGYTSNVIADLLKHPLEDD
jgi:SOS response regulatory protein OraA/RecX